jgi:hypothetical protein
MAYLSTYAANKTLDAWHNNVSFTPPTTWYLALFTTNPDVDASGTEVTGGSYARKLIGYSSASAGATTNDIEASYTGMPAATVTHWALFDALTSGNMIEAGEFSAPYILNAGDELNIPIGEIDVSFPGV